MRRLVGNARGMPLDKHLSLRRAASSWICTVQDFRHTGRAGGRCRFPQSVRNGGLAISRARRWHGRLRSTCVGHAIVSISVFEFQVASLLWYFKHTLTFVVCTCRCCSTAAGTVTGYVHHRLPKQKTASSATTWSLLGTKQQCGGCLAMLAIVLPNLMDPTKRQSLLRTRRSGPHLLGVLGAEILSRSIRILTFKCHARRRLSRVLVWSFCLTSSWWTVYSCRLIWHEEITPCRGGGTQNRTHKCGPIVQVLDQLVGCHASTFVELSASFTMIIAQL